MPDAAELIQDLSTRLRESALLGSCSALLGWDEQTYLPSAGGEHRANQLSLLAGLTHQRATAPEIGDLLDALEAADDLSPESAEADLVREARRDFDRQTRLPRRLIEELSRVSTLSQQAWVESRRKQDFKTFEPWLEQVIALKQEEAQVLATDGRAYDALLDDYEPGASSEAIAAAFSSLRGELVPLLDAIRESGRKPNREIVRRSYPVNLQREFGQRAAAAIGFDFDRGRLDVAAHPFCSGIGPGDCRLTTRYDEHDFPQAFFGTLHEAGHGVYEQGLPSDRYGTPLGEACSTGIHESQSRMWENLVGRSRSYWEHAFPLARAAFPESLGDVELDAFHAAINDVRPSFIRVEADEVTYNLHIMLRFELERALIAGELVAADLPGAWDEAFERDFGMRPSNPAEGCLQDIHWSAGLVGYFPTYALGNMYASQLFAQAREDLGDLDYAFARGEFSPLKDWLVEHIHRHGRRYTPTQLIERVTGRSPDPAPLVEHLWAKYGALYGVRG